MRIAHASDLHLGHRRYPATTADARNVREQDVSDAFAATVDGIIAARPDLVCVAGDVFDMARPSNHADNDALAGFGRIRKALPSVPILLVSGNHDRERPGGGSPLKSLAHIGVRVVLRAARITVPSLGAVVLCVPESDVGRVKLEPSTERGTHLLLAHGKFSASLYRLPDAACIDPATIGDFAAGLLGDFHCFSQVAPRAWYSGSTEWVSSNVWGELAQGPKGWAMIDTDAGTATHQPIPTRTHIDLPAFGAHGLSAKELTAKVLTQLAAQPIDGAVVRQVIHDVPRGVRMDTGALRAATKGCLHFFTDERRPTSGFVGRALIPGADLPDDAPDWLDDLSDEPIPDREQPVSLQVAALEAAADREDLEEVRRLVANWQDTDPYGTTATTTNAAAA